MLEDKIKYVFSTRMWKHNAPGGWFFVSLPKTMSKEIRDNLKWQEEGWGRMKAFTKIEEIKWKTAIWFDTKIETYILPIKAEIRNKLNLEIDKEIQIKYLDLKQTPNMPIKASELILNPDDSIYHLNLRPEHVAKTIITVGDPDRVNQITAFFDTIEHQVHKREFHTQTGIYKGKRITVISTGIGTDNIDIVLNELDALFNINFNTKSIKPELTSLNIIRIGTSGAIQNDIPIDSFLISEHAVGFDNLLHFYNSDHIFNDELSEALEKQINWCSKKSSPYVVTANKTLFDQFYSDQTIRGFTATNAGFYAPQGRILKAKYSRQ